MGLASNATGRLHTPALIKLQEVIFQQDGRVILIIIFFLLPLLHGFKLFHFVHRFQNCFCFRSTTFPSAVRTFGQRLLVLHCNYNGAVAPKFDLVITFDWGVVLTQGQRVWTAFCKIFSGIPHLTIFGSPKYAGQIPYLAVFGCICQYDPPVKSYDQIKFWCDVPIVTM